MISQIIKTTHLQYISTNNEGSYKEMLIVLPIELIVQV